MAMDYITGIDPTQIQMRSLNQMVGQHSFVRILDAFVDVLDLKQLNFKYTQPNQQNKKQEGRHPFNPADLLKLYLYGYQTGVRSCRKLEYACNTNIEMMWLLKGLTPHYKTIALPLWRGQGEVKKRQQNCF